MLARCSCSPVLSAHKANVSCRACLLWKVLKVSFIPSQTSLCPGKKLLLYQRWFSFHFWLSRTHVENDGHNDTLLNRTRTHMSYANHVHRLILNCSMRCERGLVIPEAEWLGTEQEMVRGEVAAREKVGSADTPTIRGGGSPGSSPMKHASILASLYFAFCPLNHILHCLASRMKKGRVREGHRGGSSAPPQICSPSLEQHQPLLPPYHHLQDNRLACPSRS